RTCMAPPRPQDMRLAFGPPSSAPERARPLGGNAMQLPRRTFLRLAAGAAALAPSWRIARAETYPSRPVRIIVGVPASGTLDLVARLIGQWLSERLGQQFVIEERPGAATNPGPAMVAQGPPPRHPLLPTGA